MVRLYGIPNCDQIRKTKKYLNNRSIDFEFINIRSAPLSETKLGEIVAQLALDTVLNRRGATYRKLGIKDRALNDDQLFKIMLNEQTLIKRPLLENRGIYLIGYDEPKIEQFLLSEPSQS